MRLEAHQQRLRIGLRYQYPTVLRPHETGFHRNGQGDAPMEHNSVLH